MTSIEIYDGTSGELRYFGPEPAPYGESRPWNDPPDLRREKLDLARNVAHATRADAPRFGETAGVNARWRRHERAIELLGRAVVEAAYARLAPGACGFHVAFAVARAHNWPAPELNEFTSLVLGKACRTCLLTLGHLRASRLGELAERVHGPTPRDVSAAAVRPSSGNHTVVVTVERTTPNASLRHPPGCDPATCAIGPAFARSQPTEEGTYAVEAGPDGGLTYRRQGPQVASGWQPPSQRFRQSQRPASADFTEVEVLRMAGLT